MGRAREEANTHGTHNRQDTGWRRKSALTSLTHSLAHALTHLAGSSAGTASDEHVVQRQLECPIATSHNKGFSLQRCRFRSNTGSVSPVLWEWASR